jgi:hypothetical protein
MTKCADHTAGKTTGFLVVGQVSFSAAGSPEKPFCETQNTASGSFFCRTFSGGVVRDWVGYFRVSRSDRSQNVVPHGDPKLAAGVPPERTKVPKIWSNEWLLSSNARDR